MKFHKNKLLATVSAVALTFAVGACSSSSDDDDMMSAAPPVVTDTVTDPATDPEAPAPLSELATAQADAAAAALAAMTASGEAATAAEAAMAAVANLATMQTNATAGGLADEAQTAAGKAMMAYMGAKKASEDAAEAEEVTAAVEARVMAVEASANAVTYAMTASEKSTAAQTATMAELMIDGKDKSVGGTSVNADAASSKVATAIGTASQTVETGRLTPANDPEHVGFGGVTDPNVGAYAIMENAADTPYRQEVAARDITIGRTLDTSDDMARLMLVTHYAGTKMVRLYKLLTADPLTNPKAGYLSINDIRTEGVVETNNVPLRSEGTYYPVNGTGDTLVFGDILLLNAKPKEVFSYKEPTDGAVKKYVVAGTTTTGGDEPEYQYLQVVVEAEDAALDEMDMLTTSKVRAPLPVAIDYKHIHFGVWAALGAAEKDGSQELSDLGIGFVQSIGDGLTGADMPNNGTANYSGSWVAAVQAGEEDGNGVISLKYGSAGLEANLTKATITANLDGLAKLEGAIDTNTFSGTKATVDADNTYNLDSTGKFTGSFSGGFYGAQAAEAGGVFDFTSKDAVDGAFRGAFGGDRKGL